MKRSIFSPKNNVTDKNNTLKRHILFQSWVCLTTHNIIFIRDSVWVIVKCTYSINKYKVYNIVRYHRQRRQYAQAQVHFNQLVFD
jgi:hypothetical protein